jgi:glycerol-3-phosphate acyltransferase PlsX
MRGKNKIPSVKQADTCHIGIDLLGSDVSPQKLLEAIVAFRPTLKPSVQLTLFGQKEHFERFDALTSDGIVLHPVQELIAMEDDPLHAIRRKKKSSLYLGIQMLKEGHLDAFISTGNTGALMAGSKLLLSTLPGIDRPALLTLLPTRTTDVAVLDVGANTSYKTKHLVQFALMGVAFQKSRGVTTPKVGLLNIGSEERKGTPELRAAYEAIRKLSENSDFTFVGNIEARAVFHGGVDVLVTDGFTGNIFLKTAEGIGIVVLEELEASTQENAVALKQALASLRQHLHYAEYPGALLCGVNGIVIKCHGNGTSQSVLASITSAVRLVEHHFLQSIIMHK